jgi:hypothetical protein
MPHRLSTVTRSRISDYFSLLMAAEDHSQASKFPAPSLPYEADAPMLSPPTSYALRNEYALPQIEQQQPLNQLDPPNRSKRAMDRRRIVALVVFIALLACVVAVILVLRYRPEDRVVIWVCEFDS